MKLFSYRVKDDTGQILNGEIGAESRDAAARLLQKRGWRVIHVAPGQNKRTASKNPLQDSDYLALFCRQLAVLSETRPLHDALKLMTLSNNEPAVAKLLTALQQSLVGGHSLSEAIGSLPGRNSLRLAHFIKVGESAGNLPAVLTQLADYWEREVAAKRKFGAALMYPVLLGAVTLAALVIMLVFILPGMTMLFANMEVPLPLPTRIIMGVGEFVTANGVYLAVGSCLAAAVFLYLNRQDDFGRQFDRQKLRLPIFGVLWRNVAWRQILSALAVMQNAGLRLTDSLELVKDITGNRFLQRGLSEAKQRVEHGSTLKAALNIDTLSPVILQLIEVGEQTGRLEEMLTKGADYAALTAEDRLNRIQALAEPVMILLVGGFVIILVLSVVLPVLDTLDGFV